MKTYPLIFAVSTWIALAGCATERSAQHLPGAALEPADIASLNHPATDDQNKPPQIIRAVNPTYPLELQMMRITGVVVVQFVVDTDGKVRSPIVVKSPDPRFSKAAVDAVLKWEFLPGVKNGKKVNVRMTVPVSFGVN